MTSYAKTALIALAVLVGSVSASLVRADGSATMPILYNQSNQPVNTGSASVPAGYYHLSGGDQVYYYGNGTYYDSSLGQYGGSVSDPWGTANVSLGYNGSTVSGTATMPAFYNQNGAEANASNSYLPAGIYTLSGGDQIYYFGDGVYYNPSVGEYGGSSVNDSNGIAGVSLGYSYSV